MYDAAGQPVASQDSLGFRTTSVYDADGRRIALIDPANGRTTMVYDARSSMTAIANPRDFRTTYTFNGRGETVSRRSANNVVTNYTFDEVGNEVTAGIGIFREFDENNNMVLQQDGFSPSGEEFEYDLLNRLKTRTLPNGAAFRTSYDAAGQKTQQKNPNESTILSAYDLNGRLRTVTDPDGNLTTITYDSRGMRTRIDYPSGLWHETQYDANGRPTEIRDEGAFGKVVENYTYDANGNRRTIVDLAGVVTTFTYDEKDRLTQDNSTGPNAHVYNYTFDSRDNLLTTNESGTLTTMVYDSASRLVTSTAGTTVTTFTYDPNGNMTQTNVGGTITTMVYNDENQLSQHTAGGINHYNTYDGFGYLRSVTRDSTLQWFCHMDGPNVVGEWIEDTNTNFEQISKLYMLDDGLTVFSEFVEDFTLGKRKDYIVDFLGSVRGYTLGDDDSAILEATRYKPYGGVLSGGISLSYGWTGNTGSRQTGLTFAEQYNRARFYSKKTCQWITVDPLWPEESAYEYGLSNPASRKDAFGRSSGPPQPDIEDVPCSDKKKRQEWSNWIASFCKRARGFPDLQIHCDDLARRFYKKCRSGSPPGPFGFNGNGVSPQPQTTCAVYVCDFKPGYWGPKPGHRYVVSCINGLRSTVRRCSGGLNPSEITATTVTGWIGDRDESCPPQHAQNSCRLVVSGDSRACDYAASLCDCLDDFKNYPPDYNWFGFNCTDFADAALVCACRRSNPSPAIQRMCESLGQRT